MWQAWSSLIAGAAAGSAASRHPVCWPGARANRKRTPMIQHTDCQRYAAVTSEAIVQLTQARDGAVPHTAHPMPITRLCTRAASSVTSRARKTRFSIVHWDCNRASASSKGQRPGKRRASVPDVAACRFPSGAPARPCDPAAPLRAGSGERLVRLRAKVAARRHPRRPTRAPPVAFHCLHAVRRPRVRRPIQRARA